MAIVTEYEWESDTFTPQPAQRQAFRDAVAQVAAKAKEKLPAAVNGRVESAVKLVLAGDVFFKADGTIEVGSRSAPETVYTLVGHACDCQDFAYKAPEGWCAHRIAAGIQKRVGKVLAQAPAAVTAATPSQPAPSAEPVRLPAAAAPALPEAPASVNVRLTIGGRECQLTLRDHDEVRLLARLEEVLQRFPQPQAAAQPPASQGQLSPAQHNAKAMHRKVVDFCPIHNCAMKENTKDGRRWFSHYDETAGRWCKGR